jgi:hypothetical protein
MSKTKHGGKRAGAGRKRLAVPKVPIHIMVTPDTKHQLWLMCKSDGVSQALKISELINAAEIDPTPWETFESPENPATDEQVQASITRMMEETRAKSTPTKQTKP